MCEFVSKKTKIPGTKNYAVSITCATTGKPPTVVNKWGMFCEDLCDLHKSQIASKLLGKVFGVDFDMIMPRTKRGGEDETVDISTDT